MFKLFPALILMMFGPLLWGQKTLEYTLVEGDKFVIHQDATQRIVQEFDGFTHEMENKIDGLMEFRVTAVQTDKYELDMTFRDLSMSITSNMQGELMNVRATELIEDDVQSRIFHSLLNIPIRIILNKNGHISAVEGGDRLIDKMTEASGLTDSLSRQSLRSSLKGEFGSEALSNSFEQMTYIYPDKDSITSGSWDNEYKGKLSAKNHWILEKSSDSTNQIIGKADIIMDISDPGTSMHLTGEQETTITTDIESGFILNMFVMGHSSGTAISVQTGEAEIPTTISSTTIYKQIRDKNVQ